MIQDNPPYFIEVEIGSYCNRVCSWCPNGWGNRGKSKNFMRQETWEKIITDLSHNNYAGWLAFHNFNEPLADPTIYDKIKFVNTNLPNCKTAIYTNGDYLNKKTTEELLRLRVKEIRVTLYPQKADIFLQRPDETIFEFSASLNLRHFISEIVNGKRGREAKFFVEETCFHIIIPNIHFYTDRAGTVEIIELKLDSIRKDPCHLPSHSAAIDYKGNLKLCCQIYEVETATHSVYSIGNIEKTNFWELWNSDKMKLYRANTALGKFENMSVCQFCSHEISKEQFENLKSIL